jgi:hypothetical protein
MGDAPKKLVTWRTWLFVILLLLGWAGFRLYRDYQQAGGWEASSIIATAVALCIVLLIMGGVFWHANRPEPEDRS